MTRWLHRLLLMLVTITAAFLLAELLVRVVLPLPHERFAHHAIAGKPELLLKIFEPDDELGHRLRGGCIDAYSRGTVALDQILADPRRQDRLLVLNLGDSSTSGWDARIIELNRRRLAEGQPLRSPFHTYRTYAELLAEHPELYVINAGVPGYTSLQGTRFLRRLLTRLEQAGIQPDVITFYFGNNDSVWDANVRDRYRLPGGGWRPHVLRAVDQATQRFRIVTRSSPREYGEAVREAVRAAQVAGGRVILIEPITPRTWPPGLLAERAEDALARFLKEAEGYEITRLLRQAQKAYTEGMEALTSEDHERSRLLLDQARELDHLVPRIKLAYKQSLRRIAEEEHAELISVAERIPLDDASFFCDFCHPIEPANQLIADAIVSSINDLMQADPTR